jgi:hypothetical protein
LHVAGCQSRFNCPLKFLKDTVDGNVVLFF